MAIPIPFIASLFYPTHLSCPEMGLLKISLLSHQNMAVPNPYIITFFLSGMTYINNPFTLVTCHMQKKDFFKFHY